MAKKIDLRVNKALLKRAMKPYGLTLDSDGQCVTDHMGNRVPVPLADRVMARLPEMYSRIAALYVNPFVRSQQVLALMACVSAAMPHTRVPHRYKEFGPCLMAFIYGGPGSGKGGVMDIKELLLPIDAEVCEGYQQEYKEYRRRLRRFQRMMRQMAYDRDNRVGSIDDTASEIDEPQAPLRRSLIIPDATTAANMHDRIKGNDPDASLLITSEAISLLNANGREHGHFDEIITKAHANERIHKGRKTDNEDIVIERPNLAVVMTGTDLAVTKMFPTLDDGLASRFLFVSLPTIVNWEYNPTPEEYARFKETMTHYAGELLDMYHALRSYDTSTEQVRLVLSEAQERWLDEHFDTMSKQNFAAFGADDIIPVVRRRLLDAKRIMLQVALMRRREQCESWDEAVADPIVRIDDDNVDTVLMMVHYYIKQSMHLFARLRTEPDTSERKTMIEPNTHLKRLPRTFTLADVVRIGKEGGVPTHISERRIAVWEASELITRNADGKSYELNAEC